MRQDDRLPKQVAGYMKRKGKPISHGLTYRYVRADESGNRRGIAVTA